MHLRVSFPDMQHRLLSKQYFVLVRVHKNVYIALNSQFSDVYVWVSNDSLSYGIDSQLSNLLMFML